MNNTGQNAPLTTENEATLNEDDNYAAISRAVADGNFEELDRLMAVDGTEEKAKVESQEATDTPEPADGDKVSTDDEQVPEAAETAASTEQTNEPSELDLLKAELHRLRSDAGRVGHLQRTVQELQRQLTRAPEARQSQAETNPPSKREIPEKLKQRIATLKELDPDLAETFEAFADHLGQAAEESKSDAQRLIEEQRQEQEDLRFWQEQKAELYKLVPRCDEVFALPQWSEWKDSLTPAQRGLAESSYAQDVAVAIGAFAQHMQSQQLGATRSTQTTTSQGGDPNANNSNAAAHVSTEVNEEVVEARARKVAGAASVKAPAARRETDLDADAYFRDMYNKIGKQNNILPK